MTVAGPRGFFFFFFSFPVSLRHPTRTLCPSDFSPKSVSFFFLTDVPFLSKLSRDEKGSEGTR